MNKSPIIVIDDDNDDLELMKQAFADLGVENEIIAFNNGKAFLEFIHNSDKIFFILCDINMSPVDGLELRKWVQDDEVLRLKCIPFIFISTSNASHSLMKAYSFGVQGYFTKPRSYREMKETLSNIVQYWNSSQHPNC